MIMGTQVAMPSATITHQAKKQEKPNIVKKKHITTKLIAN
jgi:hypothetical protein